MRVPLFLDQTYYQAANAIYLVCRGAVCDDESHV